MAVRINCIEIQNFRKLKSTHIDFANETTLFVGANNSGKTSTMVALQHFLVDRGQFTTLDFTLSNWSHINSIGVGWEANPEVQDPDLADWDAFLPSMDIWLEVAENEVHHVVHLLPTLDWDGGRLGVRLRFEPKDIVALKKDFVAARKAAKETLAAARQAKDGETYSLELWPVLMVDYLERQHRLNSQFVVRAYTLDPTKLALPKNGVARPQELPPSSDPLEGDPFKGLIRIDEIRAQRNFSDAGSTGARGGRDGEDRDDRKYKRKLSDQLRSYYAAHLDPSESPEPSDVEALQAIDTAQTSFDKKLKEGFADALREVESLGYPGINDPKLIITTKIRPTDGLNHPSAVQYEVLPKKDSTAEAALRLPEQYNGLGYQNLISMIFMLMSFRDKWMQVGKASLKASVVSSEDAFFPPVHLVLVEEPEAHLHAQVQQVFIRKAYDVLRNHPELRKNPTLTTQLIVSTHSSHIAHEVNFSCLRHFQRRPAIEDAEVPVTTVVNLSEVFGGDSKTPRFVTRYLKTTHCDLFFADAAILVEGPAERVLVPHFIRLCFEKLTQRYVTLLEIGGSHAHRLRPLIEKLGLTTLIITDLDAAKNESKWPLTNPKRNEGLITRNPILRSWAPALNDVDALLDLPQDRKVKVYDPFFSICVTFQRPVLVKLEGEDGQTEALASTFEDALVFENLDLFRTLTGPGMTKKFRKAIEHSSTVEELGDELSEILKSGDKAAFALDMLYLSEPAQLNVPTYIREGLAWLERQLERNQLEVVPLKANQTVPAEEAGA